MELELFSQTGPCLGENPGSRGSGDSEDCVDSVDSVDSVEAVDSVDTVDTVDTVDFVDSGVPFTGTQIFTATAPGSLMLMGEHAVLQGKPALVAAINKYITVTLKSRTDNKVKIHSALGEFSSTLHEINEMVSSQSHPPFQFVLETLKFYAEKLLPHSQGFDLDITSEFSDKIGFGSSAAVVVATVHVLEQLILEQLILEQFIKVRSENAGTASTVKAESTSETTLIPNNPEQLFLIARSIIQRVQGVGSGADVAASVLGGVICYRVTPQLTPQHEGTQKHEEKKGYCFLRERAPCPSEPGPSLGSNPSKNNIPSSLLRPANIKGFGGYGFFEDFFVIEPLNVFPPLVALYSGYKTPTHAVISKVQALRSENKELFEKLFDAIELCTEQGRIALMENDWKKFGRLMNIHHGLQGSLGVSTRELEQLVYDLRNHLSIYGAKISGSGLGDCVIGLGKCDGKEIINLQVSDRGVR